MSIIINGTLKEIYWSERRLNQKYNLSKTIQVIPQKVEIQFNFLSAGDT